MKRLIFALTLAALLSACGFFQNTTSPLSDKCYDLTAEDDEAEALAQALSVGDVGATVKETGNERYVPGRLLVRYQSATLGQPSGLHASASNSYRSLAQSVRRDYGLEPLARAAQSGATQLGSAEVLRVPQGKSVLGLAAELTADPRVMYAEPDYYLYALELPVPRSTEPTVSDPAISQAPAEPLPNDPLLSEQWHLLDFGLPQAWALETGRENVVLAVLDSGVDTAHEDLRGRTLPGCDVYNGDNNPSPGSPSQIGANQRHGTHVAGIALASGNNGVGVAGVAYTGVKLLPVKVFDDSGRDTQRTATSVVARAIRWSAGLSVEGMNRNPYPANIINLSLGGEGTVQTLNDAVADARRAGALVVAASGNSESGDAIYAPANAPGVIAVGSVDQNRERSYFSNYSRTGRSVDLMAPGGMGRSSCGAIFSTLSPAFEGASESAYGCERGTSMASPFVAGVAALIWSQNPELSLEEVEARLLSSALYTSNMNRPEYGAGILCADRALGAATLCGR